MTEATAGRCAVVTGATRGIGLSVVRRLLDRGYRVAATSRTGEVPEQLAAEVADGRALVLACDVTDPGSVDAAFADVAQAFGPVEVLVANAGVTADGLAIRMPDDQFRAVLETNLTGAFRCVRAVVPGMLEARWGRVALVSSAVALAGATAQSNYAASKAGLIGMGRSLARELAARSITVNIVAPGFVDTAMTAALTDKRRAEVLAQIPARRSADPGEIAAAVAFLVSDEASYVTGAVLAVDGGWSMGH